MTTRKDEGKDSMKTTAIMPHIYFDLQMFEGGAASSAAATGGTHGASAEAGQTQTKDTQQPASKVVYGKPPAPKQAEQATQEQVAAQEIKGTDNTQQKSEEDLAADFERMIKGDYNKFFTERVENIIKARTKTEKSAQERLSAATPLFEMLANRYGVKSDDIDSLMKKFADDTSMLESEASAKGMSVEQLKVLKRFELENKQKDAKLREFENEKQAREQLEEWGKQEKDLQKTFPDFTLRSALADPKFADLVRRGLDLRTAFIASHHEDIMANTLKYTADKTKKSIADAIQSASARAPENATQDTPAVVYKPDPKEWTDSDWSEIKRRIAKGEKITL